MPIAKVPLKQSHQGSIKSQAQPSSFISMNGVHVHANLSSASAAKMPSQQNQRAALGPLSAKQAKSRHYLNSLTSTKQSKKAGNRVNHNKQIPVAVVNDLVTT